VPNRVSMAALGAMQWTWSCHKREPGRQVKPAGQECREQIKLSGGRNK